MRTGVPNDGRSGRIDAEGSGLEWNSMTSDPWLAATTRGPGIVASIGSSGPMTSTRRFASVADGYRALVIVQDGCWSWAGYTQPEGYGTFPHLGTHYAHRVSWELHRGPIPPGMHVLHRCDNPPCSNPDHLFLGTVADNMRDREQKGRGRGGPNAPQRPASRLYSEAWGVDIPRYRRNG